LAPDFLNINPPRHRSSDEDSVKHVAVAVVDELEFQCPAILNEMSLGRRSGPFIACGRFAKFAFSPLRSDSVGNRQQDLDS